jgi:murein DD-endopeptidase MepM/ murein hydrolase activator NlpD
MRPRLTMIFKVLLAGLVIVVMVGLYYAYPWLRTRSERTWRLWDWFDNPQDHADWAIQAGERCGEAPFIMPTDGYIGFLWGDSFRPGHSHQGLDIFGGGEPGVTPVIAAYSGYLSRLPDWKSTVIIRIPSDPLHPGRQIWTYYTHMASVDGASFVSEAFPPGTSEVYVDAGTQLGFQGNYSGDPINPTGVHLHFSIVKDDGQGSFRNELKISNTEDPTPYLGMPLNASENAGQVVVCPQKEESK